MSFFSLSLMKLSVLGAIRTTLPYEYVMVDQQSAKRKKNERYQSPHVRVWTGIRTRASRGGSNCKE